MINSSQCMLCLLPLRTNDNSTLWCNSCSSVAFQQTPRCQRCGLPTLTATPQCGQCLKKPPLWQQLICIGDHYPPLSHYIHQLKYSGKFWLIKPLATILAHRIQHQSLGTPLLTSVPLHWSRYLKRGYNQSDYLARALAKQLLKQHPTYHYQPLFRRARATPYQQGLSKSDREQNLIHAFKLKSNAHIHLSGVEHVAIVDDVVTTGSTIRQLCQILLEVGVKKIDIYCLCRTPEPEEKSSL